MQKINQAINLWGTQKCEWMQEKTKYGYITLGTVAMIVYKFVKYMNNLSYDIVKVFLKVSCDFLH